MSNPRSIARRSAVQAIYQWQMTGFNLSEIERQFVDEHGLGQHGEQPYFSELLHGIPRELDRIDAALAEFTEREIAQIDPVERAVLRISTYEILDHPEVPYRVCVNEGINLAKEFGASESHRFVNGLLDRVARKYRAVEVAARNKR